jgi:hypothetical protein
MNDGRAVLHHLLHQAERREGGPEAAPLRGDLPGGQNAEGIGADREKGRVAEVEQAAETHDDIEAERQAGIGGGIAGGVDIGLIAGDEGEGQRQHREQQDAATADLRPVERGGEPCPACWRRLHHMQCICVLMPGLGVWRRGFRLQRVHDPGSFRTWWARGARADRRAGRSTPAPAERR